MRIDGFDRAATALQFLIGQETGHTLEIAGQSIPLEPGVIYFSLEERD